MLEHPAMNVLVRERDHFTETEVQAILELQTLSVRDRLILRILAETGLRRRAVSWLTVDGVYDTIARVSRNIGHATEKGMVFGLGPYVPNLLVPGRTRCAALY